MNRIDAAMSADRKLLCVYFTAGYPAGEAILDTMQSLQEAGVDMIEVGMPFSDPLADGPVIQESSAEALKYGMNIHRLFEELELMRTKISLPVVLMGYLNPVMQFGFEKFLQSCMRCGVDGLILPDLPVEVYEQEYATLFERFGIYPVFMITTDTPDERRVKIARAGKGFLYLVSSASVTGSSAIISQEQQQRLKRTAQSISGIPVLTGFGIHDAQSYNTVTAYTSGGIVGTAFIKMQKQIGTREAAAALFRTIKNPTNDSAIA
jgi:tryptophan synthase alpha chain